MGRLQGASFKSLYFPVIAILAILFLSTFPANAQNIALFATGLLEYWFNCGSMLTLGLIPNVRLISLISNSENPFKMSRKLSTFKYPSKSLKHTCF